MAPPRKLQPNERMTDRIETKSKKSWFSIRSQDDNGRGRRIDAAVSVRQ